MAGWVGPAVAISLILIAAAYVVIGFVVVMAAREAVEHSKVLGREIRQLRTDLAPALDAVRQLGEKGASVVQMAETETAEIVAATRQIRTDIQRGVARAKLRLADFEATVAVVQEEIDATVIDVSGALETARAGAGMIGQFRRLIRPRRRGSR
jgi:hypothetical protein